MRVHVAILLLALAASVSARKLMQTNKVDATSQGSGGPEAGSSTLTIGGTDPLTGTAIATTFTAATGKDAKVAISGESRNSDDIFGRAANGASGTSTDGQVTAIAAQGTFATPRSSGAAALAAANIVGTGTVSAYGGVRPGFQDVQASLSDIEGSLSTTRAGAYGTDARASIGALLYNQQLGTLSESESLSSTSTGLSKAESTAGSGLPALGPYGDFKDRLTLTVTDAITALTNPLKPESSAFGFAQLSERHRGPALVCRTWAELVCTPQLLSSRPLHFSGSGRRLRSFAGWVAQRAAGHAAALRGLRRLEVTTSGMQYLDFKAPLAGLTTLQELHLMGEPLCMLPGEGASLPTSLTKLRLTTSFSEQPPLDLTPLTRLRNLHHLFIDCVETPADAYTALLALSSLRVLVLSTCDHLPACLPQLSQVQALHLRDTPNNFEAEEEEMVASAAQLDAALSQLTQLTRLFLQGLRYCCQLCPALADLDELERFSCSGWKPQDPRLPDGPWLASLRQLSLPIECLVASPGQLPRLSWLEELELLCGWSDWRVARAWQPSESELAVVRWAGRHPRLRRICFMAPLALPERRQQLQAALAAGQAANPALELLLFNVGSPAALFSASAFMRMRAARLSGPLWVALLVATAAAQWPPVNQTLEGALQAQARTVLLKQKQAFTNWDGFATANNVTGWNAKAPLCTWSGVECNDDASLSNGWSLIFSSCNPDSAGGWQPCSRQAVGTLVEELATLETLRQLLMDGQRLTGTPLYDSWANNGSFPQLDSLTLSNNWLNGTLPDSWGAPGAFAQLDTLTISNQGSQFTGTLPESWASLGAFPSLKLLDLSYSYVNGTLPDSWSSGEGFPQLANLDLSGVRLWGTLPSEWQLPELATLAVGGTLFTGSLPATWGQPGNLDSLVTLNLNGCRLNGTLPAAWGQNAWPNLQVLSLDQCRFSGSLPAAWGRNGAFEELTNLTLAFNALSSTIPASWGYATSFAKLQQLDLTANRVCGGVPAGLPVDTVCQGGTNNCVARPCDPAVLASPPPDAGGGNGTTSSTSSSSSTNVGAIVGGVVGGVVALGVLAFLALRARKGWLRRGPVQLHPGSDSLKLEEDPTPKAGNLSVFGGRSNPDLPPEVVVGMPPPLGSGPSSGGRACPSADAGAGGAAAVAAVGSASLLAERLAALRSLEGGSITSPQAGRRALAEDPVLSYISTHLASLRRQCSMRREASLRREPSASGPSASSPSSSSRAASITSGPLAEWEVQYEEIRFERPCGAGSYGAVYLAHWRETPVAVKILLASGAGSLETCRDEDFLLPEGVLRELQDEAAVMVRMRHPNVVSFMGICLTPPCIVTEWCAKGSLFDVLRSAARHPDRAAVLSMGLRLQMAVDAARGLLYLHRHVPAIVHRDVKSPNLLVDEHYRCKVADFNLSRLLAANQGGVASQGGPTNPIWMAPELMEGGQATAKSDTYAFGLVLFELLTWRLPWRDFDTPFQIMFAVLQGERPAIPPRHELPGPDTLAFAGLDAYIALLKECWADDPAARPSFDQIVPRLAALLAQAPRSPGAALLSEGGEGELARRGTL
ncbi:Serine threonine- kinase CTR1 [Chlorella sorokiniana]|uniref:Serine threonine-kinase CTR1 n=1 Tax=Chlorella sorokiniana TaxID=3076 RepID=A0A2P6U1F3_CHLSO|nr:Serine threonine- kinase CTR1 [Chlorella sorokiniana]|eukprot:PRW60140.1 Serine threonine- kinase CTR1 [Chlorella sorokiniana]